MNPYANDLARLFLQETFPEDAFFIHKAFQGKRIIVYGAGESFHYFKEIVIRQYGYMPFVVLDRKFMPGDTFEGILAFPPEGFHPSEDDKHHAIAVVCLGSKTGSEEVARFLRQIGFLNIILLNDIYEIHNPFCLPNSLLELGFQYYLNNRNNIESCLALFADDLSMDIYLSCLQTHLQRKPVCLPKSDRQEQYTPKDIRLGRGYSRFIYCGVSVGELANVFRRIGKVDELVCFEPDPRQYSMVADYVSRRQEQIARRITVVPCAVHRCVNIEPFTCSDTSFGSRIDSSGNAWVQTVTIDTMLPGFAPTIISMDIEGSELDALKGAEQTIKTFVPDLAVCVYHSPSHLWEIPHYLNSLGVGYRFYLRNYTSFISETVLYATAC